MADADASNPLLTPLSNDPESLSQFAETIGVDPASFQFAEIYSFDEELLALIPQPVYSTIFLFPVGPDTGPLDLRHSDPVAVDGAVPWFTLQTVSNACGTIAVIHSVLNNLSRLVIKADSWLSRFIAANGPDTTPAERAEHLEKSNDLLSLHEGSATQDSTPILPSSGYNHFVTFVIFEGKLWELDGRKPQPICHGPTEDLLNASLAVIKRDFHPHVPDIMATSTVALCAPSD
jgi:ubiquitin carboxyl-terminal hydrolase L3